MTDKSNMLTLDADALAERVNEGKMESHSVMECYKADARIAELEAQLATANETIADLRDFAYNRAPKIATEEADRQKVEFEAQLKATHERTERTIESSMGVIAELKAQIRDAGDYAEKLQIECSELEARLKEAEGLSVRLREIIVEHEKAAIRLMDEYDRAEANFAAERDAAIARAEIAESNAKVLADRLIESGEWLESAEARLKEADAALAETNSVYNQCLNGNQVLRRKLEGQIDDAVAQLATTGARLRDAEARADIWERNYAACGDKDLDSIIAQKDKNWADCNAAIKRAEAAEARLKEAEKKEREMGEEGRRMTDEIERLSTAVEWVLKEIQEKIAAERGLATATIKDYFRMYRRISVGFYDKDVAMLQAALSHAEQDGNDNAA